MTGLEMQRSQRIFQQWAVMDRSNLYKPKEEQTDLPAGEEEEEEEKGVELRLGLGLGGNYLCQIREGTPETDCTGDGGIRKGLKLQFSGKLEAAIQLCLYERSSEASLDESSLEIKEAEFEARLPLPERDDKTHGSNPSTIAGLCMEYELADSATNCLEPFKKILIPKAAPEQHRSSRDAHLQQHQLARKKRKMLLDEQKQQKKGKEEERAVLVSRSQRQGSSAWTSSCPKEAGKVAHLYKHQLLHSDQQMELEKIEPKTTEIQTPDPDGLPLHSSPDDPDDLSSQPKAVPLEGSKPFQGFDTLVAETSGKLDDPTIATVSSSPIRRTLSLPTSSGGNKFFPHPSMPILQYPFHAPFPPGSELTFPVSFSNPHFARMLSTTDAQSHNRPSLPPTSIPVVLPAAASFATYPAIQNLVTDSKVSPLSKILARVAEDPSRKLQCSKIARERPHSALQQPECSNNSICASQFQASSSGLVHFGSSAPGKKANPSASGNELLYKERTANSAFTSLIAAVKASQGLSAAIAAISNSSPNISSEAHMAVKSIQAQTGNPSEQSHSSGLDIAIRSEASEIPNIEALPCISQSGTTSNVPGLEFLSRDPYNLALGFSSHLTFGGTGTSPDLPWVSTTGKGKNGKSISGVVYRKHQGAIQIVCACHGKHMSPGEFVQHVGAEESVVEEDDCKPSSAGTKPT